MNKRGDQKAVTATLLILLALSIGYVLLIVAQRNSGIDPLLVRYFSIDGAYMINALLSAPSLVMVNYSFGIGDFNVEIEGNNFTVLEKGNKAYLIDPLSGTYFFAADRNVPISVGLFDKKSYYQRSDMIRLSKDSENLTLGAVCPSANTEIENPIAVIDPLGNEIEELDMFVFDFANSLSTFSRDNFGAVYTTRTRGGEEKSIEERKKLINEKTNFVLSSRAVVDDSYHVVIYMPVNADLADAKMACFLLNKISRTVDLDGIAVGRMDFPMFLENGISILVEFHIPDNVDIQKDLRAYQRALSTSTEEVFG